MSFAVFNPESFFNVYGNNLRYNSQKDYSLDQLRKFCSKKGRPILKHILLIENAVVKLRDFYCRKISEDRNLDLYEYVSTLPGTEQVWLDFLKNSQNELTAEIQNVNEQLNNLKANLGVGKNAEKYEKLSFYYQSLMFYKNITSKDVVNLAFEKFKKENKDLSNTLVNIANLYRHAKHYLKLKNMFRSVDYTNGIYHHTPNIVNLLKEVENLDLNAPEELKEIQHLLRMAKNGETTLVNQDKKSKIKTVTLNSVIEKLDYDYLRKLNITEYIFSYYNYMIESQIKNNHLTPQQKSERFRTNYVHLTKIYANLCSMNYSFFDGLDKFDKTLQVVEQGKFKIPYNETDLGFIKKKLQNTIMDINKENKSIRNQQVNVRESFYDSFSFEPYNDIYRYTLNDLYYNTADANRGVKIQTENKENTPNSQNPQNTTTDNTKDIDEILSNLKPSIEIVVAGQEENVNTKKPSPKINTNIPLNERIDQYFNGLIGLDEVKETLLEIISKKVLEGKNYKQGQMHMAFLGNPGTGKTTVARIVGKILHENGLINTDNVVEVKFSDLYQNYVGFSSKATMEAIKKAEGGVLFIDEAHQLCSAGSDNKDFRKEIINALVPELENNHNLLVIFAGYSNEMLEMLQRSDKGLFSRVNHRVDFKDFSKEEIMKLFNLEMKKRKNRNDESFELTSEAIDMVGDYFDLLIKARQGNFANGREVRITIEKILNKFGVIALNRKDIKTIDGETMKEILSSSTFKSEIISNQNNFSLNADWEEFTDTLGC